MACVFDSITHLRAGRHRTEGREVDARSGVVHAHIPLLGRHSVHTALRAAAVGLVEGLSWDEILRGLRMGEQLRLLAIPGINGSTLLDDTYNSSPDSAIAALNLMDELGGRSVEDARSPCWAICSNWARTRWRDTGVWRAGQWTWFRC